MNPLTRSPIATLFLVSLFLITPQLAAEDAKTKNTKPNNLSDLDNALENPTAPAPKGTQPKKTTKPAQKNSTKPAPKKTTTPPPTKTTPNKTKVALPEPFETARQNAIDELIRASVSKYPILRANAIEAMQLIPSRALPLTHRGLTDKNPGIRFIATVTAGMLKLKPLIPAIKPLLNDTDPSVRAAAIYTLHTLGEKISLNPLAKYLSSDSPRVRANVAMLLGLIGEPSAIPMLARSARIPMPRTAKERVELVRIQIAEAMARLGDQKALVMLRAGTMRNKLPEVQMVSLNAIGLLGDEVAVGALQPWLEVRMIEVRLAAATTMGQVARKDAPTSQKIKSWLGRLEQRALPVILREANHTRVTVRKQVAFALGWFNDPVGLNNLNRLLKDKNQEVRVAAAASILRRCHRIDAAIRKGGAKIPVTGIDTRPNRR